MTSPFVANTDAARRKMLETIRASSVDELFSSIPASIRRKKPLNLPGPLSEFELESELADWMEGPNLRQASFLGAGLYDHFSPAVVNQLTLRGEYLTAYTPYQPEVSQGTLQVLFEFQSMVSSLFGMDVSNASHYDGATALADAVLMGLRLRKKASVVMVSDGLHPDYIATIKTYLPPDRCEWLTVPVDEKTGTTDVAALKGMLSKCKDQEAIVALQSPNFLGSIEPLAQISEMVRQGSHLLTTATAEPLSLGVLKPPGAFGVDIAVGEGQSFGLPPSFGGPLLGLFTTKKEYIRQMPGRVCGLTRDEAGERSFTLTLNTREQHIRRQKATSNICTNQNLCVIMASIYLSMLGRRGLKEAATQNLSKTEYLKKQVAAMDKANLAYEGATFNEFVVRLPKPAKQVVEDAFERFGVLAGHPLEVRGQPNDLLVCVTETKSRAKLDHWVSAVKGVL